jgi:hypothetical protein
MKIRALAGRILTLGLVVFVASAAAVMLFEKQLIYYPTRDLELSPREFGLRFEEVLFTAEDGVRLHSWLILKAGAKHTVLYCHGNAGNISHRLDRVLQMQARLPVNVFLFDYRGYGRSEGSPDEEGTYRDGRAAVKHLLDERGVATEELLLFGESLGCAIALQLACERPARALLLEAPFTSIRDMARRVFPFLPVASLARTRYDNLGKIPRLAMPLVIFHGEQDETVPFDQGRRLFEAAPEPKRFLPVAGAGHNDVYLVAADRYWDAWRPLLEPRGH